MMERDVLFDWSQMRIGFANSTCLWTGPLDVDDVDGNQDGNQHGASDDGAVSTAVAAAVIVALIVAAVMITLLLYLFYYKKVNLANRNKARQQITELVDTTFSPFSSEDRDIWFSSDTSNERSISEERQRLDDEDADSNEGVI
jgi:hypothetical protein